MSFTLRAVTEADLPSLLATEKAIAAERAARKHRRVLDLWHQRYAVQTIATLLGINRDEVVRIVRRLRRG